MLILYCLCSTCYTFSPKSNGTQNIIIKIKIITDYQEEHEMTYLFMITSRSNSLSKTNFLLEHYIMFYKEVSSLCFFVTTAGSNLFYNSPASYFIVPLIGSLSLSLWLFEVFWSYKKTKRVFKKSNIETSRHFSILNTVDRKKKTFLMITFQQQQSKSIFDTSK